MDTRVGGEDDVSGIIVAELLDEMGRGRGLPEKLVGAAWAAVAE